VAEHKAECSPTVTFKVKIRENVPLIDWHVQGQLHGIRVDEKEVAC
jgi:hypothetical protein